MPATSFVESELGYVPLVLVVADDEETRDGIEQLLPPMATASNRRGTRMGSPARRC